MTNGFNFLIYKTPDKDVKVNAVIKDDTIWLTQKSMAELFGCSSDNISLHLKNIFEAGELEKDSVTEKISATAADGKNYPTNFYNLDAIISVGYRVNLEDGILANLKQFSRTKTISFVMSDIVLEEIKRHMIAKTDKANKTYCKTLGDLCFYKINEEFSREKIKELKALNVVPIVEARIDKFKKTSNFQNLNIKEVDVNVLIKRYFEGKAPFSLAEKKKYEF